MTAVVYVFYWGDNPVRARLKGRRCRVLARGSKGTVLAQFLDTGERVTCSFRALRRAHDATVAQGDA